MAVVPFSGLSGQAPAGTIGLPDNYQRITADPNAFGAGVGAATQRLGEAGAAAGGAAIAEATREQEYHNAGAVTDMLTQAQQASMDLQYGNPNDPNSQGLYALKGKRALTAYPGSVQGVQDAYQSARDSLTTDRQRQLFDRESRRPLMTTLATMGQHRANQQQAYGLETQAAAVSLNKRAGDLGYTNDAVFGSAVDAAVMHQGEADAMQGLPPEAKEVNRNKVVQDMWSTRILRTAQDDPRQAMAMLDAASSAGKVDAAGQTQLLQHLRPMVDKLNGEAVGTAAAGVSLGSTGQPPLSGLDATVDRMIGYESGGDPTAKNPLSSASGAGQFIDSTWLSMVKQHAPDVSAGKSDAQLLAMKTDGALSRKMTTAYAQDNAAALQSAGQPVTPATIYMAHGLGSAGAVAVLAADPSMSAASILGPAVMAANPQYRGKTAGDVKQMFEKKMGGVSGPSIEVQNAKDGSGTPSPYQLPDLGAQYAAVDRMADERGLSFDARQHAYSVVNANYHRIEAMGATERQSLQQSFPDIMAGLGQGMDVDIPEDRIRSVFPPDRAEKMVNELQVEKQAGMLLKGLQFAPYDEAVKTVQALQIPGTVQGGRITLRRGQLAGPGMAGADGGADAPKPVDGPEDPTNMRMRMQIAGRAQAMLQQRQQALSADPAGYASQAPEVLRATQAMQAAPNDPGALQAYTAATTAAQKLLGVPDDKVRLLTNPQVAGLVSKLTKQDPAEGDTGAQLDQMAKQYGQAWPQVFGEMVEHGKLPRDYQVLATMDQPGQVVGRQDFQRMLTYVGQKGGAARMMADMPDKTQKELRDGIQGTMEDFQGTTRNNSGGQRLYDDVKDSVMHLAAYRMATRAETNTSTALDNAYNDVIGQKYDIQGTMRVPKMLDGKPLGMDTAKPAVRAALDALKPEDLASITAGGAAGMTDADRQTAYARDVKSQGFWVPNKDDTGLALMVPVRNSKAGQPVKRADGSPMQVLFHDMGQVAPAAHGALPTSLDNAL